MDFVGIILPFLGGLSLSLFGMNIMGDALRAVTGEKTRDLIGRICNTPLRGILVGAAVTALIQSSSATTIMVIGFVNSGMMTLYQSIGVIMGANLGTTLTSWLLALTDLNGEGFLRFFSPSFFSPLLGLGGIVLLMRGKSERRRQFAHVLLGFTALIFGLGAMSGAVEPLSENESFTSALTAFSHPLLGFAAGALLTAIIQSSSASVCILGALAATGAISVGASVPIILGQNVGTCITTLLSGIGASENARRASVIHLYFNLIGSALVMTAFLLAERLISPSLFAAPASISSIAAVHTLFNLISIAVMLPLTRLLEKLAVLTVRGQKKNGTETADGTALLDERFIALPSFALTMCRTAALRMRELCALALSQLTALLSGEAKEPTKIRETLALVDGCHQRINDYLARIAAGRIPLRENETAMISHLLSYCAELERIGELTGEAAERISDTVRDDALTRELAQLCDQSAALLSQDAPRIGLAQITDTAEALRRARLESLQTPQGDGTLSRVAALDAISISLEHIALHAEKVRNLHAKT